MKEFDFDAPFDILDVVLGAKFYVGNVVQNCLDGSDIKYSESLGDPTYLQNAGEVRNANHYTRFYLPSPLSDRKHLQ